MIVLTVIVLLITSLLLLTQTSFFREKVKSQMVKLLEKQLNLEFEIESIEGNFYNELVFKDVKLSDADSVLVSFRSLKINYDIKPLLKQTIYIDSVLLENPKINLWQENDSSWNVNSIMANDSEKSSGKGTFPFEVYLKHAAIRNGVVNVLSFSDMIPSKLSHINLVAESACKKDQTLVKLTQFGFKAQSPDIDLKNLTGTCEIAREGIRVDSLLLVAGNSNIDFHGRYQSAENLEGRIQAGKIDKNDLSVFVPSFKLLCSPDFKADLFVLNDSVTATLQLQNQNQSLLASISFESLTNLQAGSKKIPYQASINFENFRIEDWIETGSQKGLVNGGIGIEGHNLIDFTAAANIKGEFKHSEYNGLLLDTISLAGIYSGDSIDAHVALKSDYGSFFIDGILVNSEVPEYRAWVDLENLDLTKFVPQLLNTTLNGRLEAEGSGFNPEEMTGLCSVKLTESSVYKIPFDTLEASLTFQKSNLNIDSLLLSVPGAIVNGKGQLNLDSLYLNSQLYGDIKSMQMIDSFVDLPITFDSALTHTSITGPVTKLDIRGDVYVSEANAYSIKGDSLRGQYTVTVNGDSTNVSVDAVAFGMKTESVYVDTVYVDYTYTNDYMDIQADVRWEDVLAAQISSRISIGDTILFEVSDFEMETVLASFYLPDTMRTWLYNNESLKVENLMFKDYNQEEFILSANGKISVNDTSNFKVQMNRFDLSQLNRFMDEGADLKGYLKSDITVGGVADNPVIEGQLEIDEPAYSQYAFSSLESKFSYINENGNAEFTIPDMGDSFFASLSVPFKLSLDSLNFVFDPPKEYDGMFVFKSVDLSEILRTYTPKDSIRGILNGRIETKGDFQKPLIFGKVNLDDGYYYNENLGIDYNDILASLTFNGSSVSFDTILVRQKNGLISVFGELDFDSTLIQGEITSSSLQIDANHFFLTKHRNYEVLIDANAFIKSKNKSPEFGGKIKVIRSDLFLPALMSDSKPSVDNDIPLLVQAMQQPLDSTEIKKGKEDARKIKEKQDSGLIDQLTGRLEVEIPRNTWVKNNDMRVELSGELEIVKNGPYFEVFGNIDVIRGQYILYGRKLTLKESEIIFQGGENIDPTLNIEAEYVYRGSDKEKRYLDLQITGELSEPDITFLLDGTEITETDGVSILIFGATSDEIGYGGQNGLLNSIGSNALTSLISSQLSKTIGSQFNLDMIEITTTENWQSAAFVVGKYITNDIFVIYQRGFGEVSGDEITPETVTIEYEINDKLFLRLQSGSAKDSGVDVILKFEQDNKKVPPKDE